VSRAGGQVGNTVPNSGASGGAHGVGSKSEKKAAQCPPEVRAKCHCSIKLPRIN